MLPTAAIIKVVIFTKKSHFGILFTMSTREELRDHSTSETECGVVYRNYLQKCDLYANHPRRCAIKKESENNKAFGKINKLQGLLEVLEHLQQPKDKNNDDFKGYIRFYFPKKSFLGIKQAMWIKQRLETRFYTLNMVYLCIL